MQEIQDFNCDGLLKTLNREKGETADLLRGWVGAWLASGREGLTDRPMRRKMPPEVDAAILRCVVAGDTVLVGLRDMCLTLAIRDASGRIYGDAPQKPYWTALIGFVSLQLPQAGVRPSAQTKGDFPHAPSEAEREAAAVMVGLGQSKARWLIAKCDLCADAPFFLRSRIMQTPYKNGSLCQKHLPQGATRAKRDEDHRVDHPRLLELAAKHWPEWTPQKHANRSAWTAMQVNAERRHDERHIAGAWITRYEDEIQEIVKGVSDGTRKN